MAHTLDSLAVHHVTIGTKGLPADMAGLTVDEIAVQRRSLFDLTPPVLVLSDSAIEHNLALMSRYCAENGVLLAPHGKTTMTPRLFARQLAHGAYGITVATPQQLRVARTFGVPRVVIANELVDEQTIMWLRDELESDPEFEVLCYVDSIAGVDRLGTAFSGARPLPVLVEIGHSNGRTGVRTIAGALEIAGRVAKTAGLRLAGVSTFEGTVANPKVADALDQVREFLLFLRQAAEEILASGSVTEGPFLVSAGGSSYFDLVVDTMRAPWESDVEVRTLLRSGCYVVHESGELAGHMPFNRTPFHSDRLRPALEIWGQVLSRPEPELALVNFGRRDASADSEMPTPVRIRRAGALVADALIGATITSMNDQHAYLRFPADMELAVGDWVGCGVTHACTSFDKWRLIPVVDDSDTAVDYYHTFF